MNGSRGILIWTKTKVAHQDSLSRKEGKVVDQFLIHTQAVSANVPDKGSRWNRLKQYSIYKHLVHEAYSKTSQYYQEFDTNNTTINSLSAFTNRISSNWSRLCYFLPTH